MIETIDGVKASAVIYSIVETKVRAASNGGIIVKVRMVYRLLFKRQTPRNIYNLGVCTHLMLVNAILSFLLQEV